MFTKFLVHDPEACQHEPWTQYTIDASPNLKTSIPKHQLGLCSEQWRHLVEELWTVLVQLPDNPGMSVCMIQTIKNTRGAFSAMLHLIIPRKVYRKWVWKHNTREKFRETMQNPSCIFKMSSSGETIHRWTFPYQICRDMAIREFSAATCLMQYKVSTYLWPVLYSSYAKYRSYSNGEASESSQNNQPSIIADNPIMHICCPKPIPQWNEFEDEDRVWKWSEGN